MASQKLTANHKTNEEKDEMTLSEKYHVVSFGVNNVLNLRIDKLYFDEINKENLFNDFREIVGDEIDIVIYPSVTPSFSQTLEEKIFVIDGFPIIVNSTNVKELNLDWIGNEYGLPIGEVSFENPFNGTLEIKIPKSMPRGMNLDFGSSLLVVEPNYQSKNILETESECYYILSILVEDSDHMVFGSSSVATGNREPISIMNQACGDFTLKQQIENNMSVDEIECRNDKHVLAERENGELSCVSPSNAQILGWYVHSTNEWSYDGPEIHIETSTFEVVKDGVTFDVEYEILGGMIQDMLPQDGNSLIVIIDATSNGSLTLTIPRLIADSLLETGEDDQFFVLIDGEEVDFSEVTSSTDRTLTIAFQAESKNIEIIGTWLV